jgi:hypothetical protein
MPWPRQLTVEVYSGRPLDPTVGQTVRCTPNSLVLQHLRVPSCGLSAQTVRLHIGQVLFMVRCATRALADYPLLGFLHNFLGLILVLSLVLLHIF